VLLLFLVVTQRCVAWRELKVIQKKIKVELRQNFLVLGSTNVFEFKQRHISAKTHFRENTYQRRHISAKTHFSEDTFQQRHMTGFFNK
jgi:hypothetical protein